MHAVKKRSVHHERCQARYYALQAVYQWQLTGHSSASDLMENFSQLKDFKQVDRVYWDGLITGIISAKTRFDDILISWIDRPVQDISPIERSVLYIGLYELMYRLDIPVRVVINEAIELIKLFGAMDSHRFINHVLDQAAGILRAQPVHTTDPDQTPESDQAI